MVWFSLAEVKLQHVDEIILLLSGPNMSNAPYIQDVFFLFWVYSCYGLLKVWADAASQVFYSLTLGFGVMLTFASYNDRENNLLR